MAAMKRRVGASIRHPLGEMNFPPMIPEARLQELVEKVRTGVASQSDMDEIAEGHIRLAISLASKFTARASHLQDVFVAEAMYGITFALSKAQEKLYDDNITPFITGYVTKFLFKALTEDKTVPVPYSTIQDRRKRGLDTHLPRMTSLEAVGAVRRGNLNELKEVISSCIRDRFEQEVINLRSLGFNDKEIAEKLGTSRSNVSMTKRAVYQRYLKKEEE